MPTDTEILILEQLAEINRRLERLEARLGGRLTPEQSPAPKGSFAARRQACLDQFYKKTKPVSQTEIFLIRQLANERMAEHQKTKAEDDLIMSEIKAYSQKIPAEYRPDPDQYKSRSRKLLVLAMVKDPAQWDQIPKLSKQWIKPKRK
ncbi:MAG: hypothetical protein A2076_01645 [Geobacteraceae bacterium GWC2_53_11]|nr:MAG: hypothetical protein A2076_01645 [Geobacteraceae bacterium GWC2_53_11]